tara:strand:+ start:15383 stop:16120 length:738 start_codon:yes stop_codon:yes gene_type:complete
MQDLLDNIDNLPKHVAIIMDGNGRWAKSKDMPRAIGHKNGVKTALKISKLCNKIGVRYLTLYTLSIENLNRPKLEINSLMRLLSRNIKKELGTMQSNNIQFNVIGLRDNLPVKINDELSYAINQTKENTGMKLVLALAYSARSEIVNATKLIAKKVKENTLKINKINEEEISNHLLTNNFPDPDLLIRTGCENRLSNFLLWQSAYTEFYFSNKFWPDFEESDLLDALKDYLNRDRRFGKIDSKND